MHISIGNFIGNFGNLGKKKIANSFRISDLWFWRWCHQGLMCPCKHLYLNALPLASIKKPRDWHV